MQALAFYFTSLKSTPYTILLLEPISHNATYVHIVLTDRTKKNTFVHLLIITHVIERLQVGCCWLCGWYKEKESEADNGFYGENSTTRAEREKGNKRGLLQNSRMMMPMVEMMMMMVVIQAYLLNHFILIFFFTRRTTTNLVIVFFLKKRKKSVEVYYNFFFLVCLFVHQHLFTSVQIFSSSHSHHPTSESLFGSVYLMLAVASALTWKKMHLLLISLPNSPLLPPRFSPDYSYCVLSTYFSGNTKSNYGLLL